MKASRNNNSLEYSLYQTLTCHNETKMYLFIVSLEEEATHTHTKPGGSTLSRNEQIKTTRTPAHTGTILLAANAASFLAEIIVLTTNFMQAGRVCSHSLVLPVDTLLRQLKQFPKSSILSQTVLLVLFSLQCEFRWFPNKFFYSVKGTVSYIPHLFPDCDIHDTTYIHLYCTSTTYIILTSVPPVDH